MDQSKYADKIETSQFLIDPTLLVSFLRQQRFGLRLSLVGGVQLIIFGICEILFVRGDRAAIHFLPLWCLDVVLTATLLIPRLSAETNSSSQRAAKLVVRIWLTCAILCLTSASLNSITGFAIDWFKVSWAMLGTFGFATLAWLFHLAFLLPAVAMSLTALLIASHPGHAYLIFGASWCLTLQPIAAWLEFGHRYPRLSGHELLVFQRTSSDV